MAAGLSTQAAMVQRGYLADAPFVYEGETVAVTACADYSNMLPSDQCTEKALLFKLLTTDGRTGWVPVPTIGEPIFRHPSSSVILKVAGKPGEQFRTGSFTTSGQWDLAWTLDCQTSDNEGVFFVETVTADGTTTPIITAADNPVAEHLQAIGVKHLQGMGTYALRVSAPCPWHVSIWQFP